MVDNSWLAVSSHVLINRYLNAKKCFSRWCLKDSQSVEHSHFYRKIKLGKINKTKNQKIYCRRWVSILQKLKEVKLQRKSLNFQTLIRATTPSLKAWCQKLWEYCCAQKLPADETHFKDNLKQAFHPFKNAL